MRQDHLFRRCDCGFTAIELLLTTAVVVTLTAFAVPLVSEALDRTRTGMAARYLQGRIADARLQAIRRSASVGLRFESTGVDYGFTEYVDGNGNGIRSAEIAAGIDRESVAVQLLRDYFPGVRFGLLANVPDIDGARSPAPSDGVRIGTSRILTLGPDGTATSGTLYVHGRTSQCAVRILGGTGRTRVLRYDPGAQQWVTR